MTTIASTSALEVLPKPSASNVTNRLYLIQTRYTYEKDPSYFKTWTSHALMTYEELREALVLHEANIVSHSGTIEFVKVFITADTWADVVWKELVDDKTVFYPTKIKMFRQRVPDAHGRILFETEKHREFRLLLSENWVRRQNGESISTFSLSKVENGH